MLTVGVVLGYLFLLENKEEEIIAFAEKNGGIFPDIDANEKLYFLKFPEDTMCRVYTLERFRRKISLTKLGARNNW